MKIFLVETNLAEEIRISYQDQKRGWPLIKSAFESSDARPIEKEAIQNVRHVGGTLMDIIEKEVRLKERFVAETQTSTDGKFQFRNVNAGQYCVFAYFADPAFAGFWLVPVSVANTEGARINLQNRNLFAVFD